MIADKKKKLVSVCWFVCLQSSFSLLSLRCSLSKESNSKNHTHIFLFQISHSADLECGRRFKPLLCEGKIEVGEKISSAVAENP